MKLTKIKKELDDRLEIAQTVGCSGDMDDANSAVEQLIEEVERLQNIILGVGVDAQMSLRPFKAAKPVGSFIARIMALHAEILEDTLD